MQDLSAELEVAVAAAREAGAMLLAEFHRPGGPRGAGGHAPIDGEVELVLRARLGDAFPDHGIRAEEHPELDKAPDHADGPTWLIDPNDGTAPFQRGHRGASISIGLIRGGEPVLGVVYAYAAPDGGGDLVAWAEGCGPVTRNGAPQPEMRWPDALTAEHTCFVSNGADGRPAANAEAVAPARFRRCPGIAYRLALVAVGEGVCAVSLNGPRDFDLAGGHALLRGAGAVLVDERGRPARYHADRPGRLGFCFGGAPEISRGLATRDWSPVLSAPWRHRDPVADLAIPSLEALEPDAGVLARAQGCWLGQLCGDALGSQVEFRSPADIARSWPAGVDEIHDGGTFDTLAGQPTDDSEMALAMARSMLRVGRWDGADVLAAYRRWLASSPFDVGNTVGGALRGHPNPQSQANGALMRVSPLGIAGIRWSEERLVEVARADALLTHPNPVCADANAVWALTLAFAIREGAAPRAVYEFAAARARALNLHPDVQESIAAAHDGPPPDLMSQMGWVRKALRVSLWALLHHDDAAPALVDVVGRGGDTDTNGAIAGGLLGAVHGRDAWPLQWRDRVLTCRPLPQAGARRPRPFEYWPCDAAIVAERLLFVAE